MKRTVIVLIPLLLCTCTAPENPSLELGSESTVMCSNGGTVKVPVESGIQWNVSCDIPEVMIAPSSYKGSCKVSITVPPTPLKEDRTIEISFNGEGVPERTFTVSQAGYPYLEFAESSYTVPAAGCVLPVELKSNSPWKVISSLAFAGVDISPVEGTGSTTLEVTVPKNPKSRQRTISVIFALVDDASTKATLKIVQTKE